MKRLFIMLTALLVYLTGVTVKAQEAPNIKAAKAYVGVVEKTGHNDGPVIEEIQKFAGLHKGDSYCAASVSKWNYEGNIDFPKIRTGLARNFIIKGHSISTEDVLLGRYKPKSGDIIVWQKGNTIFGHVGLIKERNKNNTKEYVTIEANTSPGSGGSQSNGDGIWIRKRYLNPTGYFRVTHITPIKYRC